MMPLSHTRTQTRTNAHFYIYSYISFVLNLPSDHTAVEGTYPVETEWHRVVTKYKLVVSASNFAKEKRMSAAILQWTTGCQQRNPY